MNEKTKLWEQVKRPPASALDEIIEGYLAGNTAIKPQWRYKILTEALGPCGIGWKYEIVNKTISSVSPIGNQCVHLVINFYIKVKSKWSEAIPAIGSSQIYLKDQDVYDLNQDAYKMALTDALGSAMKMVGVAADIYLGEWSDGEYLPDVKPADYVSNAQIAIIKGLIKTSGADKTLFLDYLDITKLGDLMVKNYPIAIRSLKAKTKEKKSKNKEKRKVKPHVVKKVKRKSKNGVKK